MDTPRPSRRTNRTRRVPLAGKIAGLEEQLREKKKQVEDMTRSLVGWKNNFKDRHVAKVDEIDGQYREKLQRAHKRWRALRAALVAQGPRRSRALSALAALAHWHELVAVGKARPRPPPPRAARPARQGPRGCSICGRESTVG